MEYDEYQGYKSRLNDAMTDLEKVSNPADTAAKEAIHSMKAYLDADSEDKVSTGNALDGYLRVLNQKTTAAKNVREYFHDQLKAIRTNVEVLTCLTKRKEVRSVVEGIRKKEAKEAEKHVIIEENNNKNYLNWYYFIL